MKYNIPDKKSLIKKLPNINKLVCDYLQINSSDKRFEENNSYSLLTWTDKKEINQQALQYTDCRKSVRIKKCRKDDIFSVISDVIKAGGCAGIIMNTVNHTQNTLLTDFFCRTHVVNIFQKKIPLLSGGENVICNFRIIF